MESDLSIGLWSISAVVSTENSEIRAVLPMRIVRWYSSSNESESGVKILESVFLVLAVRAEVS